MYNNQNNNSLFLQNNINNNYNNQMNFNYEIIQLKNELNNKNKMIQDLQNQLVNLNNLYNNNLNLIQTLKNELNTKEQELQQMKINLNINTKNKWGFAINFISTNQEFNYPLVCNDNDLISRLEEELYNEYPKYKDYNTYLTCNGTVLKRFKTVKENNIKKGDVILVNIAE